MPGPPQARVSDMHICPLCSPPPPAPFAPAPMPILPPCEVTVMVAKLPAARMGDLCAGITAPTHPIAKGSATVMIGKKPAARMTMDLCSGGGMILPPCAVTVLTGG